MKRDSLGRKSNNASRRTNLRSVTNQSADLGNMANESELATALIDAAKHKGIGLAVANMIKRHPAHHNKNVMVFRGNAVKLIDVIFEDCPKLITGHGIYNDKGNKLPVDSMG